MWGQLLVLAGLTGLAVAQPLLDVLGTNPTILVFNDVRGWSLVWVALVIAVVPPLVLWAIELAVGLVNDRAARAVHLAFVGVLAALVAIQVVKWVLGVDQSVVLAVAALAVGVGFAFAYARVGVVRDWCRFTVIVPVAAVALFLSTSDASALLRSASASASTGAVAAGELPPVVFVLFDELPTQTLLDDAGGIDEVRFPNLAAFADDATWYRHHTSLATHTNQAVPTLLTGKAPAFNDPLWVNHPDNLFALLAPTHDLSVYESFTQLCGIQECVESGASGASGAPRYSELGRAVVDLWVDRVRLGPTPPSAMDEFTEEVVPRSDAPITDDQQQPLMQRLFASPARAEEFLASIEGPEKRAFYFLHVVLPHTPLRFYPNGGTYDTFQTFPGGVPAPGGPHDDGAWITALSEQRHIWQTAYVDTLFGQIIAKLKQTGVYDDALVVFAADHGASFVDGTPLRELSDGTVGDLAYAPLLIKAPGQTEPVVDDSNLMSYDVTPTIAEMLGIEIPWEVDGAPAGSEAIQARGGRKSIMNVGRDGATLRMRGTVEFDDADEMVAASDRNIRPGRPGDHPLQALLEPFGVSGRLGSPLPATTGGTAGVAVDQLDKVVKGQWAGWIGGFVDEPVDGGPVDGGVVLVELNGVVVSASPLYEVEGRAGAFAALLPEGTLRASNTVRLALESPDGTIVELVPH